MLANINNQIVSVKIIDNNYNDHAKEVQILEGAHEGRYAIVEDKDIIEQKEVKTLKSLIKLVANNIKNKEELEDNLFIELVSYDIMEVVEDFSEKIQLSKKDFYTLTNMYGVYNECEGIEEVKLNLVIDFISKQLDGNNITFTEFKKLQLKNSL
ncbi:hypothetical protein [Clostridium sp.]|uniref:hypothetical protein n=1 Tax=Clostridium sp. TaxID=1506 RepID=UPI001DB6BCBE|nr:hypothetical protein [Clostridium sp.]MBS5307745.1 hypothetical protein [Clostridium sp.]